MNYYTRENQRFKFNNNDMHLLNNHGNCGYIYTDGNIIFKIYKKDLPEKYKIFPTVFDELKKINNPHFIELQTLYTNKKIFSKFRVDAYTAKYYPEDSTNILYRRTEYLLDNFYEIELLFNTLTNNHILTDDVRRVNTILGNNTIVIVDPDQFLVTVDSLKYISKSNKKKLLFLFRSILIDAISKINNTADKRFIMERDLFNFELNNDTNITSELSKRIKHVKYPIDFFIN